MTSAPDGITLRTVRAEDAEELAVLHRDAFPDFFLSSLGVPFLRQFYLGFADDDSAVSTVAVASDGRIVGSIVGTTEPAGFFSRLLKRRIIPFSLLSAREGLRRPSIIPRLLRAVRYRGGTGSPIDGALLSSIAVASNQQGRGTGSAMMRAWEQSAAAAGADNAHLTTDAEDNDPVNEFYQRLGWFLESQYTTPEGRLMNRYTRSLALQQEDQQ
ncbi:GNAT family N-acetyltransferase [Brachybacterium sp. Marseille-Q7125]|uniref:GNAT family N-acetyltransferase n=1 Tax=Brachybacterium sp. Marseille-Q7125 TaxID=2932815 RepID=UPI001FF306CD|nr:GNAT family N-acetyltransferase [Brachybacterium sp. Marseille-Q7125]